MARPLRIGLIVGGVLLGLFAVVVLAAWLLMPKDWIDQEAKRQAERIEGATVRRTAPGFMPHFELFGVLVAAALAVGWLYLYFFTLRSPGRSALRWAAGIVLLWGTFSLLWMPWTDHQKSYRSVALQLRSRMPVGADCLAQKSLGTSQAAALDYHAGIRARPFDILKPASCPLLLVQGSPKHELDSPGPRWTKLADVGRPGDKLERYRLYRLE